MKFWPAVGAALLAGWILYWITQGPKEYEAFWDTRIAYCEQHTKTSFTSISFSDVFDIEEYASFTCGCFIRELRKDTTPSNYIKHGITLGLYPSDMDDALEAYDRDTNNNFDPPKACIADFKNYISLRVGQKCEKPGVETAQINACKSTIRNIVDEEFGG